MSLLKRLSLKKSITSQKIKFSITYFFSKCDQKLQIRNGKLHFFVQCTRIKQCFFQCLFGSFYVLFVKNFLSTFLLRTETRSFYFLIFFAPFFNIVRVIIFNLILIFAWSLLFPRIVWLSLLLQYKSCGMIAWRI